MQQNHQQLDHNTSAEDMVQEDYLIIGLGQTGLAVADFLAQQGARFSVADTRYHPEHLATFEQQHPEVSIWLGPLDPELTTQAQVLVVSPGVSLQEPALIAAAHAGVEIIGDIELFCRVATRPILAITGSNGKTTVTTLIGQMIHASGLKAAIGGNIGTPALRLLAEPQVDFYVLELSSFQLETTRSLKAKAALLLNISEDHLDRYAEMQDYIFAKQRIFHLCEQAIYYRHDPHTLPLHGRQAKQVSFGTDAPPHAQDFGVIEQQGETWLARGHEPLLPVTALALRGAHCLSNALAALAVGSAARLPLGGMLQALRSFTGLPHRCQPVGHRRGVTYYNDSKATNVGATLAAVQSLKDYYQRLWLILGGEGKGQNFRLLATGLSLDLHPAQLAGISLIGRDAALLAEALPDHLPHYFSHTLEQAVQDCTALAQPGDAVLLSPACASFDQFSGYQQRGEVFIRCVQQLSD